MHGPSNHQFLIALGSNIGLGKVLPLEIIKRAIVDLVKSDINLLSISRFYETPAYPEGSGPHFINCVIKAKANYSSQELLQKLHQIEEKFERQRVSRWSARTLDLDLLAVKGEVLPSRKIFQKWVDLPLSEQKKKIPSELVLPHPRFQDRALSCYHFWILSQTGPTQYSTRQFCNYMLNYLSKQKRIFR